MKRLTSNDLTSHLRLKLDNIDVTVKYLPQHGWHAYFLDPKDFPTWLGNNWSDAYEYICALPDEKDEALLQLSFSGLIEHLGDAA